MVQEGGGHLRPAGVVDADEQHLGNFGHGNSLDLGESTEAFASEAFGEQGHEVLDCASPGQLGKGISDEPTVSIEKTPTTSRTMRSTIARGAFAISQLVHAVASSGVGIG
jgi:hypothetical protein